ncbi:type III polyketide synthase [Mechercharimyces sp. CAU 1602]|uniref:type III polyketide synthase n=1 Tax=Mechercharimyces sp. CAU 1602 TaxID=2973933 RepID=UPI002162C899|nr:3-oxoacyl-[acyl-carrier-protein] synthase III C-terminal domain-containing protein [Mechercharimyces sp. CAU 1602]MCS1351804.1 type III polyketide synthase [Mechercharimyces sp. CAU 1602]
MSRIEAVGTAVPPYRLTQGEAKEFARTLFHEVFSDVDRLLRVFDRTHIEQRYMSRPRSWFEQERSFSERNQAYIEIACQLGEKAIRQCLDEAKIGVSEVDHLVFVSTSGIATPSIDAHMINQLSFSPHLKRTPIWGLGCAGGAVGLARAFDFAKANPKSRILLLAVELCTLTFSRRDRSKSNLIATSLFADGAAAVLIVGEEVENRSSTPVPHIVDSMSQTWEDSLDVMGWEVNEDGLKVVFSRDIPTIVRRSIPTVVEQFLERSKLTLNDISRFVTHPGGAKVLEAYQQALGLGEGKLESAQKVLRSYGNMSSVTVLFVLQEECKQVAKAGQYGLLSALGPGFSAEQVLLQWR